MLSTSSAGEVQAYQANRNPSSMAVGRQARFGRVRPVRRDGWRLYRRWRQHQARFRRALAYGSIGPWAKSRRWAARSRMRYLRSR